MRPSKLCAAGLALLLSVLVAFSASAENLLSAQGMAAIENGNTTQAEKYAIQNAYAKAVTLEALRGAPQSCFYAVVKKLPVLLAGRGMQDVTQYKITARSQQGNYLFLTVEFKINDGFLRDWIASQKLNVPSAFRPRIMIAVSSNTPGEGQHEWWYFKGKKGYSLFESQLANELTLWGENVYRETPNLGVLASGADPQLLAERFGAGLLIKGTLKYAPPSSGQNQCTLNVSLIDVGTKAVLGTWSLSRRSDLAVADMQAALIAAISEDLRNRITPRIAAITQPMASRAICIEGIRDFAAYQKIVDSLSSLDGVEALEISSIRGHAICHTARIKGRLEDIMQAFQAKQTKGVDILVKDDVARIVFNP